MTWLNHYAIRAETRGEDGQLVSTFVGQLSPADVSSFVLAAIEKGRRYRVSSEDGRQAAINLFVTSTESYIAGIRRWVVVPNVAGNSLDIPTP